MVKRVIGECVWLDWFGTITAVCPDVVGRVDRAGHHIGVLVVCWARVSLRALTKCVSIHFFHIGSFTYSEQSARLFALTPQLLSGERQTKWLVVSGVGTAVCFRLSVRLTSAGIRNKTQTIAPNTVCTCSFNILTLSVLGP